MQCFNLGLHQALNAQDERSIYWAENFSAFADAGSDVKSLVIKAGHSQGWMRRDSGVRSRWESTEFTFDLSLHSSLIRSEKREISRRIAP